MEWLSNSNIKSEFQFVFLYVSWELQNDRYYVEDLDQNKNWENEGKARWKKSFLFDYMNQYNKLKEVKKSHEWK